MAIRDQRLAANLDEIDENLECPELKNLFMGSFMLQLSSKEKNFTGTKFYLAKKGDEKSVEIGKNGDWSMLKSENFHPSRKTYIIVHGYRSKHEKSWILSLKKKLLENRNINIIIIDWSSGSYTVNYVNAVKTTIHVAKQLVQFLDELTIKIKEFYKTTDGMWNHLYFIGHSLGAHISGQTAHILKTKQNYLKVERITGLDPAQPCFTQIALNLKLDKRDADFVDVIHTQTGRGGGINGFGLKEAIGHVDFYVNGGVMQPQCKRKIFFFENFKQLDHMVCSHKYAALYFIESIVSSKNVDCKFSGHQWNKTYSDALQILDKAKKGNKCVKCPEMGIDAVNYKNARGTYLVLTSSKEASCGLDDNTKEIEKVLELLKPVSIVSTTRVNIDDFTQSPFIDQGFSRIIKQK